MNFITQRKLWHCEVGWDGTQNSTNCKKKEKKYDDEGAKNFINHNQSDGKSRYQSTRVWDDVLLKMRIERNWKKKNYKSHKLITIHQPVRLVLFHWVTSIHVKHDACGLISYGMLSTFDVAIDKSDKGKSDKKAIFLLQTHNLMENTISTFWGHNKTLWTN